jgi:hypothetical protein
MLVHPSTLNWQMCISWARPTSSAREHDLTKEESERERERNRERARKREREKEREKASASVCFRSGGGTTFQMSKHPRKS